MNTLEIKITKDNHLHLLPSEVISSKILMNLTVRDVFHYMLTSKTSFDHCIELLITYENEYEKIIAPVVARTNAVFQRDQIFFYDGLKWKQFNQMKLYTFSPTLAKLKFTMAIDTGRLDSGDYLFATDEGNLYVMRDTFGDHEPSYKYELKLLPTAKPIYSIQSISDFCSTIFILQTTNNLIMQYDYKKYDSEKFCSIPCSLDSKIMSICAGDDHWVAIANTGIVYTMDQLSELESDDIQDYPKPISPLQHDYITQIACDFDSILALNNEGHVYAWAANTDFSVNEFTKFPQRLNCFDNKNIGNIFVKHETVYGLSKDGLLYSWSIEEGNFPEQLLLNNDPILGFQIGPLGGYSLAKTINGNVYVWGRDDANMFDQTYDPNPTLIKTVYCAPKKVSTEKALFLREVIPSSEQVSLHYLSLFAKKYNSFKTVEDNKRESLSYDNYSGRVLTPG